MSDVQDVVVQSAYEPRPQMKAFHQRRQRSAVVVCHRRFGKTVAAINDLVEQAMQKDVERDNVWRAKMGLKPRHPGAFPRYAYVCPELKQAKDNAWEYLKTAVINIPNVEISESELWVKLPSNGARIRIYGIDKPESLRGGYLDGVILDEYGDMRKNAWAVVRPMLSDYQGFVVYMGTHMGRNAFWKIRAKAIAQPKRFFFVECKSSESGVLPDSEIRELKADLEPDEFEREYECSFDVPVIGSYWGKQVRSLIANGHIRDIKYDAAFPVDTVWDIGRHDATAVWFYQFIAGEYRFIDHINASDLDVDSAFALLSKRPYKYGTMHLPHDAGHQMFAARGGRSIANQFRDKGCEVIVYQKWDVVQSIAAVRRHLPYFWFDQKKCADGLEHLKAYTKRYDAETKTYSDHPLHDEASHTADAMRYMVMTMPVKNINMTQLEMEADSPLPTVDVFQKPKERISKWDGWTPNQLWSDLEVSNDF